MTERFSIFQAESNSVAVLISDENPSKWEKLKEINPSLIFLSPKKASRLHYSREFFNWLQTEEMLTPVILNFEYNCTKKDLVIQSAAECG